MTARQPANLRPARHRRFSESLCGFARTLVPSLSPFVIFSIVHVHDVLCDSISGVAGAAIPRPVDAPNRQSHRDPAEWWLALPFVRARAGGSDGAARPPNGPSVA